jgi:flagellar biosynthesis/type III secretory pathway protein FliH
MARLEGAYEQIDRRLATVEGRLENLELKVDAGFNRLDAKIDARFDALSGKIDSEIKRLDAKIDSRFDALNAKIDRVVWVVVIGLLITILVNLAI